MDALACFMLSTDYERRSSECWESPLQAPTLVSEPGQSIDRIDEQHAPDALHSKELSCMRGCSWLGHLHTHSECKLSLNMSPAARPVLGTLEQGLLRLQGQHQAL